MKKSYFKKISLLLLVIPILVLTLVSKPIKASYVILDNVPFNFFYDVEMVYAAEPTGAPAPKAYILISWNKYLNEDNNPYYMRAYENVTPGYFDTSYDKVTTYRSPDYVQQSQTFVKNQFIDWFGVETGTIYSQYFTILEIVGGTNMPAFQDLTFIIYANRGGYIAIDYTTTIQATTDPTKEFDKYIALENAGYNQGVADVNIDIQVIRNSIRAEELAKYATVRDAYERYIEELELDVIAKELKGYSEGLAEGLANGALLNDEEVYDEAYKAGLTDGSNNKFYDGMEKWLVPAIIVVLFMGGVIVVLKRRSED